MSSHPGASPEGRSVPPEAADRARSTPAALAAAAVPCPDLPPGEPARSQRISIVEGSFANIHLSITGGSLVTAYALMLGANDFHLGLVAGLTALATLGSILGAQWVTLLGGRKALSVAASPTGRFLWALLCLLPFLPIAPAAKLAAFFAVILVGNGLVNLSGTSWLSWMTDLVPIERRGRYFATRNAILGAAGMATSYAAGHVFDSFEALGMREQGFAVLFGAAAFFAVLAGITLTRQWEPPLRGERPRGIVETLRRPIADRRFRPLLTFLVLWSIATGVASPFFAAHMIKNLHMSFSSIAVYSILAGIMNLATLSFWGKVIDRVGNRPVLAWNVGAVVVLPLLWLFATPTFLLPIWIDAVLTGIFWPGLTLATFNLILATAPEENRTAYLGIQAAAVGVFTFAASLLGGALAKALGGFHASIGPTALVNFHLLYILSAVLRLSILPLVFHLREERAQTVATLLDLVGDKVSQRFREGLQSGVAILRKVGGNGPT